MDRLAKLIIVLLFFAVIIVGTKTSQGHFISLDEFRESVINGNPDMVVGAYQENEFAQVVIQQPEGDYVYLPEDDSVAQLYVAQELYGNIGLAAHNHLAGRYIAGLEPGEIIQIIYGDGSIKEFEITGINSYQAIAPDDVYSNFRDIEDGKIYDPNELFEKEFGGNFHVSFITCIAKDDLSTWGRIIISGYPVD